MYFVGCDLGSTAGKAVVLERCGRGLVLAGSAVEPSGLSPDETADLVVGKALAAVGRSAPLRQVRRSDVAAICCTGYGRENVASVPHNVSEITCHARGAHFLRPSTRTIVDVGGQDVKAIAVSPGGGVLDFAMNDKCAAGTGKFFEAMARTLRCSVEELGRLSLESAHPAAISSTCSVFAESEVITHINKGVPRCDIAGGIHESIARRLHAMVQRVGLKEDVVLTGGCAKNEGLRAALEGMLRVRLAPLSVDPQINGALGAALAAYDRYRGDHPDSGLPEALFCGGVAVEEGGVLC